MHKFKRVKSVESLFDERAKWREGLRYCREFDPEFKRFADPNDPWFGRKPTSFYKSQKDFQKEGLEKQRIKNVRAKSTEYPAVRVEQ